ncbi:MAG: DUF3592 domain-containing protein [Proteobacteria bacterium]|nr:DUF3592 domain-containing protein [Pseudomonadota bacterium]
MTDIKIAIESFSRQMSDPHIWMPIVAIMVLNLLRRIKRNENPATPSLQQDAQQTAEALTSTQKIQNIQRDHPGAFAVVNTAQQTVGLWVFAAFLLFFILPTILSSTQPWVWFIALAALFGIARWKVKQGVPAVVSPDETRAVQAALAAVRGVSPERVAQQRRQMRILTPVLVLLSLLLIGASYFSYSKTHELTVHGVQASGTVVRMDKSYSSSGSHTHATYQPVVSFADQNGRVITFHDSIRSNPPAYRVGEKVTVLYLTQNPPATAAIDRGLWNWAEPVGCLGIGVLLLWLVSRAWRRNNETPPSPPT